MNIITDFLNLDENDVKCCSSYIENDTLIISVTLSARPHRCPVCSNTTSHIKEYKNKYIKHAALNRKKCIIHYHARRYVCDSCNTSFYEDNPFVPSGHTISNLAVMNVINELKESNATFASVARHNFISSTKAQQIFDTYVHIPRRSFSDVICIDEVYALKDNHSKYVCLLLDFRSYELIDVLPERKKYSLLEYFDRIPKAERDHVRFFVMDMYRTYRDVVHVRFKSAKIAVDSFHVMKNINDALDRVRIRIMKGYHSDTVEYYLLKNFKWLLLANEVKENKPRYNKRLKRWINYPQLLELILNISPELREAYRFKDRYCIFNTFSDYEHCEADLKIFADEMKNIKSEEMKIALKMIRNWQEEIINSFIKINGKRLSNGIMESRNSIVKLIKKAANGYVNFMRFRNRCMYCMNKSAKADMSGSSPNIKMNGKARGKYKKKKIYS